MVTRREIHFSCNRKGIWHIYIFMFGIAQNNLCMCLNFFLQSQLIVCVVCHQLTIVRYCLFFEQVHDEVILEGPEESENEAMAIVVDCMSKPFGGKNILRVDLSVDSKCAKNWYSAK